MNLLKSIDVDLGKYMCKATHPLGGVDSSNPHRRKGWLLHHHSGGVCWVFALCVASCLVAYVDKDHTITLRWGYMHYSVSHPGLHHTTSSLYHHTPTPPCRRCHEVRWRPIRWGQRQDDSWLIQGQRWDPWLWGRCMGHPELGVSLRQGGRHGDRALLWVLWNTHEGCGDPLGDPWQEQSHPKERSFKASDLGPSLVLCHFLELGKQVEADNKYVGHLDKIKFPKNSCNPEESLGMQGRAGSHHETINRQLKNRGILSQVFHHNILQHGALFLGMHGHLAAGMVHAWVDQKL